MAIATAPPQLKVNIPAEVRATSSDRHSSGGSVRPTISTAESEKPSSAAQKIVAGPTMNTSPAMERKETRPETK